ncbi:FtsW/RodA/SpoVE family cell cycle protein [Clostridium paridis]
MKLRLINLIPLIITIPAISIGVVAMYNNKVPILIWAQNIACFIIATLISYFVISNKFKKRSNRFYSISIIISMLLIILTYMGQSINGVHRWVSIGFIKFNVSMMVLPLVIIALWSLHEIKSLWVTITIIIAIAILLAIQPDASEVTGFSIPMVVMLCSRSDKKVLRVSTIGILSILVVLSWVFLDNLPPVAYVERIVSLLSNMGLIWLVFGIISLVILPAPFIFFSPKNSELPSISVGLYFVIILISTLVGNFPVPLMGYGISPIIGYFIPITWYAKSIINS